MRQGFDRGVIIGIISLATMMVGIAATSYVNTRKLRDDSDRASHSRDVLDAVATIRTDVRKLQAGQRAYIISGVEDWLAPYDEASVALRTESSALKSLTVDDTAQRPRAETLAREIEEGVHSLNQVIALRRKEGYEAVRALSLKRGSRSFVDPLLDTLAQMDRDERIRLVAFESQAREAYDKSIVYGITAAVLGLIALGLFVAVLRRSIFRRARDASQLDAQRQLLSATLSSIGDAVIATDAGGNVTFLNRVAEKLTGWLQGEAAGHPLTEIYRIDNATTRLPVGIPAYRALEEGVIVGLANPTVLIARDGTELPIDDSAAPMRDSAGAIIGTVLVFRDVTERKRADEALRESETRYRAMVEATPECVMLISPDGTLLQMNPAGLGIFEVDDAGSVLGECIYDVISPSYREEYRAFNERVCRGEGGKLEFDIVGLKGARRHMETTAVPLPVPGGGFNHLAVTRDVTDRRIAEGDRQRLSREVEAEREQLAQVFQMAPSFMCVLRGPEHVYERANERYFELVGRRDFIGRTPRDAFPEVASQGFFEILDNVYKTGEPFIGKDMPIVIRRGGALEKRYREFVYQPLRDDWGTITGILVHGIDLTDRKRSEETLARVVAASERERRMFESALSNTVDFIYMFDLDGRFTYINKALLDLWQKEFSQAVGRNFFELSYPPELAARLQRQIQEVIETRQPLRDEALYTSAVGTRAYEYIFVPVFGPDGAIEAVAGSTRDITDRKRAEEQLRTSEERFRSLFETMGEGFCVVEMLYDGAGQPIDYRFLKVNPTFEGHTGLKDAVGRTIREMVPGHDAHWFEIYGRVAATGEAIRFVNEAKAMGRWYDVYAYRAGGPDSRRVAVLFTDITNRKQAEQHLARVTAESERRKRLYETALSNTPDLVYVFDLDHRFTYANEALLRMWGRSWDEAIGKRCLELGYEPWHAAMHDWEIDQIIATKHPIRGEVPFTGTGGRRIYDYIFVPVFGANGEVEAVAGTTRDVTNLKQIEEALRDADRKKDDFLALLAHELRNPLAPIRNGLQVMRLAAGDSDTIAQARAMMDRQLSHMVRLIDDLLDVSRISRNKMELRLAHVKLTDAVKIAIETARPTIDEFSHELMVDLTSSDIVLEADLTRLAQVFSNLLTNSAKYTERGGRIWLSAEKPGKDIVVSVRDTGIGIPAEAQLAIFDMFSQVDRRIERNTGGLGIGLALVKGLVEMHGGTVAVRSDGEGRGSTFTVTLPALPERVVPTPTADSEIQQVTSGPKRRILVVDDNLDGANSMAMMLDLIGNEVRTANDGLAAVEEAQRFRPEIILMDVGMPKLNGLDATRRIREQPWGKGITVVALTGWGQDGDKERAREAGCNGHLVKPVTLTDLGKLLSELRNDGG